MSHTTVLTIMSEIGIEGFCKFKTAKQFASWLRLAPNNKISGGKVLSNHIPKGSNRLKIALRNAANVIGIMKNTALSKFFAKIAYKKGRQAAISATARKLAVIIWNMVVKQIPYHPQPEYLIEDQRRRQIAIMKKNISKFGINVKDLGLL